MKLGLWVLAALIAGVVLGALARQHGAWIPLAEAVSVTGALWLDALRMTLAPLIFAVLVASVAQMAETAALGPLARRALLLFAGLITAAAAYAITATHGLLAVWPIDSAGGAGLVAAAGQGEAPAAAPVALQAWAKTLIPTNVVAAAAEDAILPLVVFACLFGLAITRLPPERRHPLQSFFQSAGEAMIVIVQWVLALAPLGVFGLSLALGLAAGLDALGALAHYVSVVSLITIGSIGFALLLGLAFSGVPAGRFLRAIAPVQVIAASTQSSLASLPAMLTAAMGPLGLPARVAEFALPLAVAVFRLTSPVANLAVVVFVVHLYGLEPSLWQWAAAGAVAFIVSISSVGLPGQSSFFASIAPICMAVGAPVAVLPLLLAVEVIPDVFRTIGNVTADVSATCWLHRMDRTGKGAAAA
jgi:Na+/H+-dicarboxylate symporter